MVANAETATFSPESIMIIDTHVHFYDTERPGGVPWPEPTNEVLYRPSMPSRFKALAEPSGITGATFWKRSCGEIRKRRIAGFRVSNDGVVDRRGNAFLGFFSGLLVEARITIRPSLIFLVL